MSSTPPNDAGDRAPAPNNNSQQPSIMNIKSIPTNSLMEVQSDVLEPLTFSQTECVFELQPKGFLHPGSAIQIAFDVTTNNARAFPFVNTGILSLIRRAVLRTTAGRVINDCSDLNHLNGLRACFVNNSINKEREQYLSGRQMDFEILYDAGSDVASTNGFGLSTGMEYNQCAGDQQGVSVQPYILNAQEPEFQIKIHDLFNYCKEGNQIPLFLLPDERLQIVLYFEDGDTQRNRLSFAESSDADVTDAIVLNRNKCKFIADYTFYQNSLMDKFRDEYANGLTFSYTDFRLSKQSVVNQAGDNVRNIGGNGNVVNKVYFSFNSDPASEPIWLQGKFNSLTPSALGGAGNRDIGDLTSNLFMNSEFLFPQDINNPARQFHNLKETEGLVPFLPRNVYSGQGANSFTSATTDGFEGQRANGQRGQLEGNSFYQGFRVEGLNQRVDNRGIDLHTSMTADAGTQTHRAWLELKRYLIISDGHLETYYV